MREWNCIVIFKKILAYVAQQLIPDPLLRRPLEIIYQGNGSGIRNEKQPNIRYAFGDPLYRWSFASVAGFPDQEARWLYEIQPEVEKFNLELNKKKAASPKLQA